MATIEDVKALLLKGLDPRNTINQLNHLLYDPESADEKAEISGEVAEPPKKKRGFGKKS